MDREEFRQNTAMNIFANLVDGYYNQNNAYTGLTIADLARKADFAAERLAREVFDEEITPQQ